MEKSLKSRSQSARSRFPTVRGVRTPSAKAFPQPQYILFKQDMMIRQRVQDQKLQRDHPPAVHAQMQGKFLIFRPIIKATRPPPPRNRRFFFKFLGNQVKLIRWIFQDNGIREGKKDWLIGWSSTALRSNVYNFLQKQQKVNHFPRSHEITKKDSLFKNISRMQTLHGKRFYSFVPDTYVIPQEVQVLSEEMEKDRNRLWIIKPAGSSQGRGIFLTNKVSDIPPGQQMVASEYLSNPLLINGLKFDLRVYVAVTSIDPLRIYIYREGLVRFATQPYDLNNPSNRFVHLTNYSLNKYSPQFQDLDQDGKGYK